MVRDTSNLTSKNFDKFVRGESKVVVDFGALWCAPCQMFEPIFQEVAKEMKDKAKFAKVNVDDNLELAQRFGVMSIPTTIFFRDGKQVDRVVGVISKEELMKRIKNIK